VKPLASLTLVLALVTAACGSGSGEGVASLDDTATTTTTTPEQAAATMEEAMLAFTECLREHGLDVEDPDFNGQGGFGIMIPRGEGDIGGPDEETRAAMEACQPLMEGVRSQFQDFDPTEIEDQLYAFAECMRGQGIDWPDPDLTAFAPGGGANGPGSGDAAQPGAGSVVAGGPFGNGDVDMTDPAVQSALESCQTDLGFGFARGGPGGPAGPGGTTSGGEG